MSEKSKATGFDEAIIGQCSRTGRIIYDVEMVIEILMKEMNEEDAWDYFYFNIEGAWVGDGTPIWCERFNEY